MHSTIMRSILLVLTFLSGTCACQLKVLTTVPDLADLAEHIGGPHVQVESLTAGHEDLHLVPMRPSFLTKLRRTDLPIELGLQAEHAWLPELVRTARNSDIKPGAPGNCVASAGITPLEVPESTDRGQGPDLHPSGNPHFNLDPESMRIAARNIRDAFIRKKPEAREDFTQRAAVWEAELNRRLMLWHEQLAPFEGAAFMEHHGTWSYFAKTFKLRCVGRLEPKPGVSPTASHFAALTEIGKRENVGLVVARPANADLATRAASLIGAHAVLLSTGSHREGEQKGWFAFMDQAVQAFAAHLKPVRK
ncbi:MAG TPA: metal ABC transporter substrate-binding protein [Planctomycetota bacterium]|nr:metal ABC transporter substrate-binding protein [Planctomycetota bacterium]